MKKYIKSILKKNDVLYGVTTKLYEQYIEPIKTGHLSYYVLYLFTTRNSEVTALKSYGLTNIKTFSISDWRIGRGKDHAYRRYYSATYKGEKVFVKVGVNDTTVQNEFKTLRYLQNKGLPFAASMVCGNASFINNSVMVAVNYIPDLKRFHLPEELDAFKKLCGKFLDILEQLKKEGVVHADIHAGNLMLREDDIILLDFGISKVVELGNAVDYSSRPGTFYRNINTFRRYDDAYSFIMLLDRIGIPDEWKNCEEYKQIIDRVDDFYFDTKI